MEVYRLVTALVSLHLYLALHSLASIDSSSRRKETKRFHIGIQRDDDARRPVVDFPFAWDENNWEASRVRRSLTREGDADDDDTDEDDEITGSQSNQTEKTGPPLNDEDDGRDDEAEDLASYRKVGLDAHNRFRAEHGAKDLVGNDDLHGAAVKCAEYYLQLNKIDNSCPYKTNAGGLLGSSSAVGENIWYVAGWSDPYTFVGQVAIRHWYAEGRKYHYFQREPPPTKWLTGVGHFTQLVWKGSRQLGFGIAERGPRWKGMVVVALYHPAGNRWGEFKPNVGMPSESEALGSRSGIASILARRGGKGRRRRGRGRERKRARERRNGRVKGNKGKGREDGGDGKVKE